MSASPIFIDPPSTQRPASLWVGVMLLVIAGAWRLAVLVRSDFAIDGDEGTIGLMALHISRGIQFPIFFYGQPYMGALESYTAALPMVLFGASGVVLKLTGLVYALITVWIGWILARRTLGSVAGLVTGLYLALPPFTMTVWSLKLRGGYTSLFAMGLGILLLAHHIGTHGATKRNSFGLGLLVGLTTWLNLLAFPIVAAAGLYLLSRRELVNRVSTFGLSVLGFVIGLGPFIATNLASHGETFHYLSRRTSSGTPVDRLAKTFADHLPILLGIRSTPGSGLPDAPWAGPVMLLFGLGVALFAWRERASLLGFLTFARPKTSGAEMYVLTGLFFLACTAFTRYGSVPSVRFHTLLYLCIAPVFGVLVAAGWERRGPAMRAISAVGLALLLTMNVHSLWQLFGETRGPYTATDYDPYLRGTSAAKTLALLQELGVDGFAGDHFPRHALNFLSGDTIVPATHRYPGHRARFRQCKTIAWAAVPSSKQARVLLPVLANLEQAGVVADRHFVDGHRISVLRDTGHPSAEWQTFASVAPAAADSAVDRNPHSGWLVYKQPANSAPPKPQWIVVDLRKRLLIRRIGLIFGIARPHQVTLRPPRLSMKTSLDGKTWSAPFDITPDADLWSTDIAPVRARYVRLDVPDPQPKAWELLELFLYENEAGSEDDAEPRPDR